MPAKPMPEVHLTLGMVILAGESRETAALPLAEARAATASLLAEPCRSTSSKTGVCSSCEGGFDVDEVAHVRMIFQQLKIEARSQLLSTCWSTGKDSDASRAAWRFLGKRVCLRRLTALLGCSARTFQKATHGGSVDLRQNNGRARADASISVDQFFFEMYNSAAELLPEDPSCHVEDIDNSIDADERPAASAVPTLQPHSKFHQMLPILGWDPSQTFLQDVMTASMDEQDLPIRYIQNQKPIDLWWQYLAWAVARCGGQSASWSTFWRRWHGRCLHLLIIPVFVQPCAKKGVN